MYKKYSQLYRVLALKARKIIMLVCLSDASRVEFKSFEFSKLIIKQWNCCLRERIPN